MDTKVDLVDLLTGGRSTGDDHPHVISITPASPPPQPMDFITPAPPQPMDFITPQQRPAMLQLPSSPSSAEVPSISAPTTPEQDLDLLHTLLAANIKVDAASDMVGRGAAGGGGYMLDSSLVTVTTSIDAGFVDEDVIALQQQQQQDEEQDNKDLLLGLQDLLTASLAADQQPVLSPVSADEVESILSSSPPTPGNGLTSFIDTLDATNNPTGTEVFMDALDISPGGQVDSAYSSLNVSAVSDMDLLDASLIDGLDVPAGGMLVGAQEPAPGPVKRSPRKTVQDHDFVPYTKPTKRGKNGDRKERKKQQNRSAALRYRQKKKTEKGSVDGECEILQERNTELKDKVDSISREINYLKDLLAEVYKAKGLVPKKSIAKIMKK